MLGKPADVDGRLVDDLGNAVATFGTFKNGLGRLEFTPATGRSYQRRDHAAQHGITEKLSAAAGGRQGLRAAHAIDDFDGQEKALRVAVRCTRKTERWWSPRRCARTCSTSAASRPATTRRV